ncbi:MAG: 30S ribosomal protein S20 [Patescibacteria group bacterium]|nr:30S ribosomal protein S20 [Patescibacteria group bacterium]
MPILKSAIKKLRQDKKRTAVNKVYRENMRQAVKQARKEKTVKSVKFAYAALDKAAKQKIIHKNKAARLKSRLMKLIS